MTSVVEFPLLGVPSFLALVCFLLFFNFFKKIYLFIFREVKGEREGEKHQCVVPTQDLAHTTQACPLTGNQTLVHKPGPNPLSPTSQGLICFVDCGHHRVTAIQASLLGHPLIHSEITYRILAPALSAQLVMTLTRRPRKPQNFVYLASAS